MAAFLAKKTLPRVTPGHTQKLFIQNQLKQSCRKNWLVYFITEYKDERGLYNGEKFQYKHREGEVSCPLKVSGKSYVFEIGNWRC